jgi:hypothetical protein
MFVATLGLVRLIRVYDTSDSNLCLFFFVDAFCNIISW